MFSTKRVLAVMPDKAADLKLADYLDFLASTSISIDTVNAFHAFTATHFFKHLNETPDKYGNVLLERMQKDMEKQLDGHLLNIPNKQVEVISGQLVPQLIRKGYDATSDLIALGEHSESDITLSKQIIRHVPENCLFVPEKAAKSLSHILVPVDMSKHSAKLLEAAIHLKEMMGDDAIKITCYHSFEVPSLSSYSMLQMGEEFTEKIKEKQQETLHQFVEKHTGDKRSEIEEVVQEEIRSRPDRAIINYMEKNGVDFLIMGSKSHSALDAWLGNTVERVIAKNDKVPMLIIK